MGDTVEDKKNIVLTVDVKGDAGFALETLFEAMKKLGAIGSTGMFSIMEIDPRDTKAITKAGYTYNMELDGDGSDRIQAIHHDSDENHISVLLHCDDLAERLSDFLNGIKHYSSQGAGTEISQDGEEKSVCYIDGDGADELKEITYETVKDKGETKEARDGGISYGCAMTYLDTAINRAEAEKAWKDGMPKIPAKDLHEYGIENEAHCTVLYGLHTKDADDIKDALKPLAMGFYSFTIGEPSLFENEDYDVLIRKVENIDGLVKMRKALMKLDHTLTFKDYHPHATIAYLKKGKGKEYLAKLKAAKLPGIVVKSKTILYSTADEAKTQCRLQKGIQKQAAAPLVTTAGRALVNSELPEEYRDYAATLKGNDLGDLLKRIANERPDLYKKVSHRLLNLGANAAYKAGSTIRLEDFDDVDPKFKKSTIAFVNKQEQVIASSGMTEEEQDLARTDLYQKGHAALVTNTMKMGAGRGNNIVDQVIAKARGNPVQVTAMLTTPGTYADAKGRTIPIFIQNSYAQGLTPAEYYAATFGARTSVIATKFCLAAGTRVRMSNYKTKAIEDIKEGERVFAVDDAGEMQVTTVTGVSDNGTRECFEYLYTGKQRTSRITCTPHHKILNTLGKMVQAGAADNVRVYYGHAGYYEYERAELISMGELPTYDIEVDHDTHRFVLANGMVVGNSTRNAGDLGKQINQAANNLMVTEEDCGTSRGIPVRGDDMDNHGAVLARDTKGFSRGSIINSKMLRKFGDKKILVRSPITCAAKGKGICSKCAGVREKGTLPPIGSSIGISAASALAERIAQGSLNCLATGTDVLMADLTVRPIEKLTPGDRVMGSDLFGNTFPTTVTAKWNQGIKPVTRYTYANGATVESTEIHQILQLNEDSGIPDLQPISKEQSAVLAETYSSDRSIGTSVAYEMGKKAGESSASSGQAIKYIPELIHTWSGTSIGRFMAGFISNNANATATHFVMSNAHALVVPLATEELTRHVASILSNLLCIDTQVAFVAKTWEVRVIGQESIARLLEACPMSGPLWSDLSNIAAYSMTAITDVRSTMLVETESLGNLQTWDISVAHSDSLFLLANGIIVKNTKHTGGQKSTNSDDAFSGFKYINQFTQIPKHFSAGARLAEVGGTAKVTDAPQGGWYVQIGDEQHHIEAARELTVKDGEQVEAGDALSDGLINPGDVTRLKGLGAGRLYYADRFTKLYRASGLKVNRRNVEIIARGAVNQIKVDDEDGMGDYLPDDTLAYSDLERSYKSREGTKKMKPGDAIGRYLEAPALHYTIGTPITSRVAKELDEFEIDEIESHDLKPKFTPDMQRMRVAGVANRDNWLGKMQGSYLTKNLLQDLHQGGAAADIHGVDPIPAIIYGKELGQHRPGEVGY